MIETETIRYSETPPKAGKKEWIGLAVIALPCLLYSMDLTVLNLALPAISADLQPSSAALLWIVDIYGFMVAGCLVTMGTLGDRIGRRKLLMIGAGAFGLASILAAFSNSSGMLILTRAILGITGATIAPSTLSLIRNMFNDPVQRTFAIGVWATSYSVGGALGPVFGGLMLQHFWWGSVFLISVPVMVILLVLGPVLLPEYRNPNADRIDLFSAFLSLVSVLAVIFSMKEIASEGFGWLALISVLLGITTGSVFIKRQRKLKDPFVDLQLFTKVAFNTSLVVYTLAAFVAFGSFFFIAQYLQLVMGLSPLEAGLWSLPSSVGFVAGSMFTPAVVKHFKPGPVIGYGLILAAIGFAILLFIETGGLFILVTSGLFYSLGISPCVILSTDLIVGSAPPERSGSAASLSETSAEMGGAVGIAVLGSIGTAIYRTNMSNENLHGISDAIKLEARETLGGAFGAAEQLTDAAKNTLVQVAQESFRQAFETNAIICAILAAAMGVIAMRLLKDVKGSAEGHS